MIYFKIIFFCHLKLCALKLRSWISVRPYQAEASYKEGGHENVESEHTCCPVLSCSFTTDQDSASYFAMIDENGQVVDFLRLKHLMWRRNSRKEHERKAKVG